MTKAELQLATSQGQVANAQGNVKKTYIALSFLVGQSVEGPLVPPDNTTRVVRNSSSKRPRIRSKARSIGGCGSPPTRKIGARDVRSLHEKNEGLAASASEPLYRLIPTLSASGQLRFDPQPLGNEKAVDEQGVVESDLVGVRRRVFVTPTESSGSRS